MSNVVNQAIKELMLLVDEYEGAIDFTVPCSSDEEEQEKKSIKERMATLMRDLANDVANSHDPNP